MIASVAGVLVSKSPNVAVVDVHGVGYQVYVPLSTFYQLPELGKPVSLHIYTHVREDALQLYGFLKPEEKTVFLLLLGISGIGPKLALNILSGLPIEELVTAIKDGNVGKLSSIPGVGKKTAERLALELKDRIGTVLYAAIPSMEGTSPIQDVPVSDDAVSALVNLGYKTPQAKEVVRKVIGSDGNLPIESLIKAALKILSR
jgi:holliday junction DNA helicase RuvA